MSKLFIDVLVDFLDRCLNHITHLRKHNASSQHVEPSLGTLNWANLRYHNCCPFKLVCLKSISVWSRPDIDECSFVSVFIFGHAAIVCMNEWMNDQIENYPIRLRAQSKVGSFDFFDHVPAGGDKKVDTLTFRRFLKIHYVQLVSIQWIAYISHSEQALMCARDTDAHKLCAL